MATWPPGMSGTGMNNRAASLREERIHRADRLAAVAFLSRRMACFVMIIMLLWVTLGTDLVLLSAVHASRAWLQGPMMIPEASMFLPMSFATLPEV